jgi:NADH-quinone oxidoreductase subunit I
MGDGMTMKGLLNKIFMTEILKGMVLTFKTMLTPAVTRQYPETPREALPGFRGLHGLVRDQQTGEARCVGCGLCAAICPSQCIHVYTNVGPAPDYGKIVERYEIEVLRCVYCGLCVEACPYSAVVLTQHYEYSGFTRGEFAMDKEKLLANWDKYMGWDRNMEYFKHFWHPRLADFTASDKQAVFTGKKGA